ncbi:MAG: NADH-quinone oxidoreductase subunit J [Gemmatimonas sp.]|uniref:NADH-quinone oxidoreductase subunit J family protein n=1 Tax=Gemmatimonas sp. TaxID=1962908 RepID=UPI00391F47BA|nr:NADH-quinone oxidoreductase subunit J [Gemmatimonadota bacterium]
MILALFGVIAFVSAASMLVLREPMRVALALIASMTSLGAIYGLIGVHFIAAFQVLIYVGAVMVFMVYVIMLLEVREAPGRTRFSRLALPGVIAGALLSAVLGISVMRGRPVAVDGVTPTAGGTFTLTQFSAEFLSSYWLEFELTTVLLVGAIVAALAVIAVSRRQGGHRG